MNAAARNPGRARPSATKAAEVPLSALISQLLVAFTIELDSEFELRLRESGRPASRLSLVLWLNLIRFLAAGEMPVRDLARRALVSPERVKHQLACLERWGYVVFDGVIVANDRPMLKQADRSSKSRRDGWGSGRGIRGDWIVRLTAVGQKAAEIWSPLPAEIEKRWQRRFGKPAIKRLRQALGSVVGRLDAELPQGLPGAWPTAETFPPLTVRERPHETDHLSLPVLLSQSLLAFTIAFDREAVTSLDLCANVLRVLGETPVRLADLPRLAGGSPEQTDIGWQLKPYVIVEADPQTGRGKVVRLSPLGLKAQQIYRQLARSIETSWETTFGKKEIQELRLSLRDLLDRRRGDQSVLAEGLVPPPGVARAGAAGPALGRRDIGPAAKKRLRDLVIQTETFIRDPAAMLPHYPMWDMNRGFGP